MGLLVPAQLNSIAAGRLRQEAAPIDLGHTLGPLAPKTRKVACMSLKDKRGGLNRAARPKRT